MDYKRRDLQQQLTLRERFWEPLVDIVAMLIALLVIPRPRNKPVRWRIDKK